MSPSIITLEAARSMLRCHRQGSDAIEGQTLGNLHMNLFLEILSSRLCNIGIPNAHNVPIYDPRIIE
jgi:hypothetical protein